MIYLHIDNRMVWIPLIKVRNDSFLVTPLLYMANVGKNFHLAKHA